MTSPLTLTPKLSLSLCCNGPFWVVLLAAAPRTTSFGESAVPAKLSGPMDSPMVPPALETQATCTVAGGSRLAAPRPRPVGARPCLALTPLPGRCLPALSTGAYLVPLFV